MFLLSIFYYFCSIILLVCDLRCGCSCCEFFPAAYVGDDDNVQVRIIAGATVAVVILLVIIIIMTVVFLRR